MKRIKGKSKNVILATGLAVSLGFVAPTPPTYAEKPAAPDGEVSVSGVFSGTLQDIVLIGEREVLITGKTAIFRAGTGLTGRRNVLSDDSVWVTGRMEGDVLVARMVVVTDRPHKDELHQLTDAHRKPGPKDRTQ